MGTTILYRNVHTGLRQRKEPEPIVSYCAGPVPVPPLFTNSVNKPLDSLCVTLQTVETQQLTDTCFFYFVGNSSLCIIGCSWRTTTDST